MICKTSWTRRNKGTNREKERKIHRKNETKTY
jgi:hypothetical protein